jgi:hypothetical protein
MQDAVYLLRRILLPRPSEKGRRSLRCSFTEHLNGAVRPILASLYLPIPRSERCSYPFSDSLSGRLSELSVTQAPDGIPGGRRALLRAQTPCAAIWRARQRPTQPKGAPRGPPAPQRAARRQQSPSPAQPRVAVGIDGVLGAVYDQRRGANLPQSLPPTISRVDGGMVGNGGGQVGRAIQGAGCDGT